MSSDGYLSDAATRHQVHVQRYAGGSLKRLAKFITKAIGTAKSRVSEGLSRYGTQRYERQIQELQGDLATIYGDMKQQAVLDLTEFGGYEAEFNMNLLGKVVKAVVQLHRPSVAQVAAAALADPLDLEVGKGRQRISINGALDQYGTKKSAEIISEIRMGSALGETSGQISRRLTSLGVQQRDQAQALVNTMTNHIASTARVEVLKDNDDILKGMRRVATLDSRTTMFCMSIDQTVIPLDGPKPPYHWRCRTTIIPVLKDEFAREIPGSTRPSVGPDGVEQVSSKTSYSEWLARQPAAFQSDVLGPERYKLFSKGELSIDRFVDDDGKTLTLKELREREPMAFERAGMN
ncbi:phage head morphogenesis protein [Pseudomonas sp. B21-009]|uniref:phage head morphogenesis protein n=1 Tax=Pseudomonas sp. B21-009 TaxID=2895470 RepID=UPI00215FEE7A|nr:phage head morphogenesis protein [Pseudomonas sp. B21-009]UVM65041.1 phage head morphogenesis protein [Pseudomonas sp. B21-009]